MGSTPFPRTVGLRPESLILDVAPALHARVVEALNVVEHIGQCQVTPTMDTLAFAPVGQ